MIYEKEEYNKSPVPNRNTGSRSNVRTSLSKQRKTQKSMEGLDKSPKTIEIQPAIQPPLLKGLMEQIRLVKEYSKSTKGKKQLQA